MPDATARSISSDGGACAGPTGASATCGTAAACNPSEREDRFVESVFALQQLVDATQIFAGLRSLNDAVIVGARELHHARNAEQPQRLFVGVREPGGITDRARRR